MDSDDLWAATQADLHNFAPGIRSFLRGDTEHTRWAPAVDADGASVWRQEKDRIRLAQLGLLQYSQSGRPDMLLYALGELHILDPGFTERLDNFMSLQDHTVLVNASASGKTRMLFESLCNSWGLYFTCYRDYGSSPYGSFDLSSHIRVVKCRDLSSLGDHPTLFARDLDVNVVSVHHMCMVLVSVRLLVLNLVLDIVRELEIPTRRAQRLWLLFQLRSDVILNKQFDLFTLLYGKLRNIDSSTLETKFRQLTLSQNPIIELITIDEANVATLMHPKSFVLSDGRTFAPVLRPLVHAFSSVLPNTRLVVSGTQVDVATVEDAIRTSASARSQVVTFHSLGAFNTVERTRRYVEHFFGRTPAQQIRRVHGWFQGRHRWLANYVENILHHGPQRADAIIRMSVFSLTGYDTDDTDDYIPARYGLLISNDLLAMYPNRQQLRVALFNYALRGQVSTITGPVWQAVATSVATFNSSTREAVIWEPIVFYRLFTWIRSSDHHRVADLTDGSLVMHAIDGLARLASYFFQFFRPPDVVSGSSSSRSSSPVRSCLSDILSFSGISPYWARGSAHLVLPACNRAGSSRLRQPEGHSIAAASGPEDVLRWLASGEDPFMIPDAAMGVDLLFFIELEHPVMQRNSVLLVSLQVDRPRKVDRARRRPTIVAADLRLIYKKASKVHAAVVSAVSSLPIVYSDTQQRSPLRYSMLRILCGGEAFRTPQPSEPPVATLQLNELVQGGNVPELDVSRLQQQQSLCLDLANIASVLV